ncbi:UDP-MurNac-pentapeptide presynthetase MurF [Helicobacter didelphidarum]|uniref:UDP-MurNac-pentapeptide presynthetase MurF n=1 Tax=Helicobacter didelphidarum TaxID=2040648 RepID=A0A3D8INN9_9HELI|nr:UDP-N-acetylmuramoyl-tripeptide--D-alanyl-D-alanine ligase [Helicobacter didelphidarum]RDU66526.1 UDP-MurNac-pentapeptide presynthetase MurF [Helicobacter didelphidarum]
MPDTLFLLWDIFSLTIFFFTLGYYVIVNLQWYNYNISRVITKHHKQNWHLYYFVIPILFVLFTHHLYHSIIFYIYLYMVDVPMFILWYKRLDKKLIYTARVKRYFTILAVCVYCMVYFLWYKESLFIQSYFIDIAVKNMCLIVSFCVGVYCSLICELILFKRYASYAHKKIQSLQNLTIIAITGSYGKTSIKNFVAEILSKQFNTYATPRSVNTYKGLVSDINQNLTQEHRIYIAEAGARNQGDIAEISNLLQQHYGVIGKIGNAHIEYFKDIQTTISTKFEMLYSNRLHRIFMQKDNTLPHELPQKFQENLNKITPYPANLTNIESTLEKTSFSLEIDSNMVDFETQILGRFNIDNIAVAILLAKEFGMEITQIQEAIKHLKPIPHRLNKIVTANKIILDDSFNGNLEGMSEAIRLSSLHIGRRVIVTPGLVEYDEESNIALAKYIDEVFQLVIITGNLNTSLLSKYITKAEKIILKDKANLESTLSESGKNGDLVLFANDAPNYI